jgi:hypothetical protein
MRRASRLFEEVIEWSNLREAAAKAMRGKRHRPDARRYLQNLDSNLQHLAEAVRAGTIPVGRMHTFLIRDPKERVICAPCFEERVLHHAIMNVCEPWFERWLIDDTYACRREKGRIAALLRARDFSRRFRWCVKLDVRKYFESIPHSRLLDLLARRFKDLPLLALWRRVIQSHRGAQGRGLPIGSLTSQHFANFYLGWLDRFAKEQLRVQGYVRYMDDMAFWARDRSLLEQAVREAECFLKQELALELKPCHGIQSTRRGFDLLGCRVFPDRLTLSRRSRRRFARKLCRLEAAYRDGRLDESALQARAAALTAFTRTEGVCSWRFRTRVLERLAVGGH